MAETPIGEVTLKNVRLSFADIFEPGKDTVNDDGEKVPGKYKANGLMAKDAPDTKANMAKLKKAKEAVIEAKWGKNPPKIKADKICVRDGDEEDWEGYANCWYISASEKNQPVLITRRKDSKGKWIEAKPGDIYSGCYVNMVVQLWAQDNKHGKRINANLKAIQFFEHGPAFSGAAPVDPNEKFADIDEEDHGNIGDDDDDDDDVI